MSSKETYESQLRKLESCIEDGLQLLVDFRGLGFGGQNVQ